MHRGFSLVELSIALVILGLLVGGVLTGQSLIRAAELRSVTTQHQKFVTAVNSFKDKYFALPGDMTNATQFWGAAHATPATCVGTAGTGTQTCNGDGNGGIDISAGSNEVFRFWQHLANAGIIEGQYDGIPHGSGACGTAGYCVTKENVPTGKISTSLWFIYNWGTRTASTHTFNGVYGNSFEIGGFMADSLPHTPIFRPEELWNIDTKTDDGKPATGKVVVITYPAGLSTCTTTVADNPATLSADYLLTATSKTCAAMFRQQF